MNWWAEGYGSNAWRGYKWAFSLCPTDIKGRQSGSIGYTYLALGGNKDIVIKMTRRHPMHLLHLQMVMIRMKYHTNMNSVSVHLLSKASLVKEVR